MMPTGTNLTYVSAAGTGHYPIPRAGDGYRTAHAPQQAKPTGLDWDALTPTGDTRPVRCRWCRHISDDLDDDQLCPACLDVATQPPTPEPPTEGKQGKPTTGSSAPGATPASSTTGRAPVAGPSTTEEKNPAAAPETRPAAAAGPPALADAIAACWVLAEAFTDLADALHRLHPPAPVAAPAPQVSSNPPGSSDRPDAATGTTPPPTRRSRRQQIPGPRRITVDIDQLRRLYVDQQQTITQVALNMHHSPSTIRAALDQAGIPRRDDRSTNSGGRNRITTYPPALVAGVRRLYLDEGLTQVQVAKRLGVSTSVVQNVMARHDIPARPAASQPGRTGRSIKLDEPTIDQLVTRYQAGESANALAKAYSVSLPSVLHRLRQRGVTIRPRGGVRGTHHNTEENQPA